MSYAEPQTTYEKIEIQRLKIGDCLFSPQRHEHRISNARKLVALAVELAELAALLENDLTKPGESGRK